MQRSASEALDDQATPPGKKARDGDTDDFDLESASLQDAYDHFFSRVDKAVTEAFEASAEMNQELEEQVFSRQQEGIARDVAYFERQSEAVRTIFDRINSLGGKLKGMMASHIFPQPQGSDMPAPRAGPTPTSAATSGAGFVFGGGGGGSSSGGRGGSGGSASGDSGSGSGRGSGGAAGAATPVPRLPALDVADTPPGSEKALIYSGYVAGSDTDVTDEETAASRATSAADFEAATQTQEIPGNDNNDVLREGNLLEIDSAGGGGPSFSRFFGSGDIGDVEDFGDLGDLGEDGEEGGEDGETNDFGRHSGTLDHNEDSRETLPEVNGGGCGGDGSSAAALARRNSFEDQYGLAAGDDDDVGGSEEEADSHVLGGGASGLPDVAGGGSSLGGDSSLGGGSSLCPAGGGGGNAGGDEEDSPVFGDGTSGSPDLGSFGGGSCDDGGGGGGGAASQDSLFGEERSLRQTTAPNTDDESLYDTEDL